MTRTELERAARSHYELEFNIQKFPAWEDLKPRERKAWRRYAIRDEARHASTPAAESPVCPEGAQGEGTG